MRIRTITVFINPGWPIQPEAMRGAAEFLKNARVVYEQAGAEIQTVRLACPPFPVVLREASTADCVRYASQMDRAAGDLGIGYVSLGPASPEALEWYAPIPEMLAATQNAFVSASLTTAGHAVSLPAVRACGRVIAGASRISPDGFGNLRFTALGNVPGGSPFFPAAYMDGDGPSFAVGMEAAEMAVRALSGVSSLGEAHARLVATVSQAGQVVTRIAESLAAESGIRFRGIDFTLAPFPEEERSFGTALEQVGVPRVGLAGTLSAAAFLADALDRASFPRTGFSGLFLPVLEDAVLARRAAEGLLTLNELLLYSTVCGAGLDCIPLSGDAAPEQLSAVLADLASLSLRLDKPLTARLMPVPGKREGEETGFDFAYFANSRILGLPAEPLGGLLAGDEEIDLFPRKR